jgi:hypothetical protein
VTNPFTRFEVVNLLAMRLALDDHNTQCPEAATAILLHPYDHGLLRCDRLWGLPVIADERVKVKRIWIECDGATWTSEHQLPADDPEG